MTNLLTEQDRHEEGVLLRDFVDMSPEAVRLRKLIDAIGAFVVVQANSAIDVVDTIAFNGE